MFAGSLATLLFCVKENVQTVGRMQWYTFTKVTPRFEKTEVFGKGWNFVKRTYFATCIVRKHFLLWIKETAFFSLFLSWNYFLQHWAIWFDRQLWILLEHLYNFKHKHKSNIKVAIFELRSSNLFRDQRYKEVLEVKCQACNLFYPLRVFLTILVTFFWPVFCRTSHNLICNKFAKTKIHSKTFS